LKPHPAGGLSAGTANRTTGGVKFRNNWAN
jgi:hypothetical protein